MNCSDCGTDASDGYLDRDRKWRCVRCHEDSIRRQQGKANKDGPHTVSYREQVTGTCRTIVAVLLCLIAGCELAPKHASCPKCGATLTITEAHHTSEGTLYVFKDLTHRVSFFRDRQLGQMELVTGNCGNVQIGMPITPPDE